MTTITIMQIGTAWYIARIELAGFRIEVLEFWCKWRADPTEWLHGHDWFIGNAIDQWATPNDPNWNRTPLHPLSFDIREAAQKFTAAKFEGEGVRA